MKPGQKPLTVFYVIDIYDGPSGGTERQLLLLIRGMQDLGHQARLFVLRHSDYTRGARDFPCPIECLCVDSIRSLKSIARMRAFRRRVATDNPDVVHAFFNDAAILVPLHCWRTDAILFTSRRDMGFWYTRATLLLLYLANRRVNRIVCNSSAVAEEAIRRERVSRGKIEVIPNGLVIDDRPGEPEPRTGTTETVSTVATGPEVHVCLLANLRPIKRIEDFIQAAAKVTGQMPNCRFLVIGESLSRSYEESLRRLAEDLAIQDRVEFRGLTSEPMRLLRSCQIGVLASESEGLSNAILEYMAAGLPVVCSDVGGNPELVIHGRNGYLYPCGDVAALADRLGHLCRSATERERMGEASLERARSFTPERMIEAHLRIYQAGGKATHG